MSFRADPESIDRFGRSLADLSDDPLRAVDYVNTWVPVTSEVARMFGQVTATAEQVRLALVVRYSQLHRVVADSSAEVHRAAESYRATDAAEAARLDATC